MKFSTVTVIGLFLTSMTSTAAPSEVELVGSGSTFLYPIAKRWFDLFDKQYPRTTINYVGVGSGKGISSLLNKQIDFAGSDGPLSDEQVRLADPKVLHFPVVLGAVVPVYNLPPVKAELNFTPAALASIYLGKVPYWDDPMLVSANPGSKLPHERIKIWFRTDKSGTTYVWTDYLSKVSEEWRKRIGKGTSVEWDMQGAGNGVQFNEGMAQLVSETPYSIGYVTLTYAMHRSMATGRVQNSSGRFVKADSASVTAAARQSSIPEDFRVSITNSPATDSFPIVSFSWLLVPSKINDPGKKQSLKALLNWIYTEGQGLANSMNYSPLPQEVVARAIPSITKIQ